MPSCCIPNCTSRTFRSNTKGITYYRFPKKINICQQWLDAYGNRKNIKIESGRLNQVFGIRLSGDTVVSQC